MSLDDNQLYCCIGTGLSHFVYCSTVCSRDYPIGCEDEKNNSSVSSKRANKQNDCAHRDSSQHSLYVRLVGPNENHGRHATDDTPKSLVARWNRCRKRVVALRWSLPALE